MAGDGQPGGYEKKHVSLITTTAGMAATVTAMIIGSLFGAGGTLWGAALGSGVSATAGTLYENAARKAHARYRATKEQERAETEIWRHPYMAQKLDERAGRELLIRARQKRILMRERNPWRTVAISFGLATACMVVAIGMLISIEKASGRTLHSELTGRVQYGTSFNYTTKAPPVPSVTVTVTPTASTDTATANHATATPDASPTIISGSGGAPSAGLTGMPSTSSSATPTPSGPTAPAANAQPSSSRTTG